jgi:putative Mg2+ transporter-C (MgtC) family protein
MILISLGSAGFVVLAQETFANQAVTSNAQAEISRVLQGLIGGIGFLGAGTIIQNRGTVYGLTTAAAVWCVAAVGASCGLGHYGIAGLLAAAMLFTLVVLRLVESRFFPVHVAKGPKVYGEPEGEQMENGSGSNGSDNESDVPHNR